MAKGERRAAATKDAWPRVDLGGRRYVILPESAYERLRRAAAGEGGAFSWDVGCGPAADKEPLGERIAERRREVGLTQVALAAEAKIRVETLNRIERGKTTPDFATIRKIVEALDRIALDRRMSA